MSHDKLSLDWNPMVLFQIENLEGTKALLCPGHTKDTGTLCKKAISPRRHKDMVDILDNKTLNDVFQEKPNPKGKALEIRPRGKTLANLAGLALCHIHQKSQRTTVTKRWAGLAQAWVRAKHQQEGANANKKTAGAKTASRPGLERVSGEDEPKDEESEDGSRPNTRAFAAKKAASKTKTESKDEIIQRLTQEVRNLRSDDGSVDDTLEEINDLKQKENVLKKENRRLKKKITKLQAQVKKDDSASDYSDEEA